MKKPFNVKKKRLIVTICQNRCTGYGNCAKACLTGALQIINGKSKLVNERLCDGFGSCIAVCPNNAIKLEYKFAEDFDWSILNSMSFEKSYAKIKNV